MSEISKFGRGYDREFKEKAVALVVGGRSHGEVSRDLGVSAWSLGEWIKKAKAGTFRLRQPPSMPRALSSANRAEGDRLPQTAGRVRAEVRIKS